MSTWNSAYYQNRQWTSVYCGGIRTVLFGKWNRTFIHKCEMGTGKQWSGTIEQVVRKEASYCTSSTPRLENRITEKSPVIPQFTTSIDGTESCWIIISSTIERENTWDEFNPQWRGEWYKYIWSWCTWSWRGTENKVDNIYRQSARCETSGNRYRWPSVSTTKKRFTNSLQISIQFHIKWSIETDRSLL